MAVSLELIEQLRERADVSYEEAKAALEKFDGDIVEALIYLEQQNKTKKTFKNCTTGFMGKAKNLLKICNETRMVISKNSEIILNLSLTIVIIATVIAPPLALIALLLALLTGHRIRLEKPGCTEIKLNKTLDDISTAVSNMGSQVADAIKKE